MLHVKELLKSVAITALPCDLKYEPGKAKHHFTLSFQATSNTSPELFVKNYTIFFKHHFVFSSTGLTS